MTALLEMKNVTKRFPGVIALDNVSIEVNKGEILAICGENGAGKSTLMNVLSGKYDNKQYEGDIYIEGKKMEFKSVTVAKECGIEMVHQELTMLLDSTLGENIFIGNLPYNGLFVDFKQLNKKTKEALDLIGLDISPKTKARKLGSGQLQMVSIVRALENNPKILVLDEPTSSLTDSEIDKVMELMDNLRKKGITCIFISHKLNEVFRIADRVVVMRDGKFISCREINQVTENQIIEEMVGRDLGNMFPKRNTELGEEVFRVEDLTVPHPTIQNRNIVENISFNLRKGEILGIGGLVGAGRSEMLTAIFGADSRQGISKKIYVHNREKNIRSPRDAVESGIGFVTEERKITGYVPRFSVCWNLTLAKLNKLPGKYFIKKSVEKKQAREIFDRMNIKAPSLETKILNLSGGNQQKVILGKWLLKEPEILFIDEPTKGIDVGAKAEFYRIMNELTDKGVSIIMVSSDMPELVSMSDRCLVFSQGTITGELTGDEITQINVLKCALSK